MAVERTAFRLHLWRMVREVVAGSGRTKIGLETVSEPTDPPPPPLELALNSLVVALEEMLPGLADRWADKAEDEALHSEVRRLHAKAENPALIANLHAAMTIARHARFVARAHVKREAPAEEAPKRKGRRARE